VKDSKRNDGVIHNARPNFRTEELALKDLNCLAVSKGYWPINYESASSFQVPADLQAVFAEYSKAFAQIKAMRRIFFHYNLGHVDLTLTFDNGPFDFKCLPLQAILISYFDEGKLRDAKNGISSEELSN
jgi:anaphase-promoting complex subunit 2